jgi:hypothetical protein
MRFAVNLSLVLTAIRTMFSEQSAGEDAATNSLGIKLDPIRRGSFLMGLDGRSRPADRLGLYVAPRGRPLGLPSPGWRLPPRPPPAARHLRWAGLKRQLSAVHPKSIIHPTEQPCGGNQVRRGFRQRSVHDKSREWSVGT